MKLFPFFAVVAVSAGVFGCGGGGAPSATTGAPIGLEGETTDAVYTYAGRNRGTAVVPAYTNESSYPTPRALMHVFRRGGSSLTSGAARDVRRSGLGFATRPTSIEDADSGRLLVDEARYVLRVEGTRIVAVPTTKGWVCYALFPDDDSDCVDPVSFGQGISIRVLGRSFSERGVVVVYGVARDGVKAIEVKVRDKTYKATRGENAYFVQLPPNVRDVKVLRALVVTREGSPKYRLSLDWSQP